MAKTITIHKTLDYLIESTGNGFSYRFESIKSQQDIYFQGDDAREFYSSFEAMENIEPETETNELLRRLWNNYCELATDIEQF